MNFKNTLKFPVEDLKPEDPKPIDLFGNACIFSNIPRDITIDILNYVNLKDAIGLYSSCKFFLWFKDLWFTYIKKQKKDDIYVIEDKIYATVNINGNLVGPTYHINQNGLSGYCYYKNNVIWGDHFYVKAIGCNSYVIIINGSVYNYNSNHISLISGNLTSAWKQYDTVFYNYAISHNKSVLVRKPINDYINYNIDVPVSCDLSAYCKQIWAPIYRKR